MVCIREVWTEVNYTLVSGTQVKMVGKIIDAAVTEFTRLEGVNLANSRMLRMESGNELELPPGDYELSIWDGKFEWDMPSPLSQRKALRQECFVNDFTAAYQSLAVRVILASAGFDVGKPAKRVNPETGRQQNIVIATRE